MTTRKVLRRTAWALLTALLTPLLMAMMLYIPPIQRWVVQKAASYASEATGMDIRMDALHIAFPLDLEARGLSVRQDSLCDVSIESAIVDLDLRHIFNRSITVEGIDLSGGNAEITIETSTEKDTATTTLPRLALDIRSVTLDDIHLLLHMPQDSMRVETYILHAMAGDGDIRLDEGTYGVGRFSLEADSLAYNELTIKDIAIEAEDILYRDGDTRIAANIRQLRMKEGHGIDLGNMACELLTDTTGLWVRNLELNTAWSMITGHAGIPWKALQAGRPETLDLKLHARIGHGDIQAMLEALAPDMGTIPLPEQPLTIDVETCGNADSLAMRQVQAAIPTVACARASGTLTNVTDSLLRGADLTWEVQTADLSCLRRYLNLRDIALPPMQLTAQTRLEEMRDVTVDMLLRERQGKARLLAKADLSRMAYEVRMNVDNMQVHDFLPHDSIYRMTARLQASGEGTDMLSKRTRLKARLSLDELQYAGWNTGNISLEARLGKGNGALELYSDNDLLKMQACLDATLQGRKLKSSEFRLDMSHIDLYALRLARDTLSASMVMHAEGSSDFRQTHRLTLNAEAMELVLKDTVYHPVHLGIDADLSPDHIQATANAGDLRLDFKSRHGLDSLLARCDAFMAELKRQTDSLSLRQDTLRTMLPDARLYARCGGNNPVSNLLRSAIGYTYSDLNVDLTTNPTDGIKGDAYILGLNTGAALLDTISLGILQKDDVVRMKGRVRNGPKNRTAVFESEVLAEITPTGLAATATFTDAKGTKGVDMGLEADILGDGMRVHFTPLNPVIAYRKFTINEDNFIELTKDGRLEALVDLLADDGTGVQMFSTENPDAKQDFTLNVNHLNLGELSSVMPYMPEIQGFLHGDFHLMQADSLTTVSAMMDVKGMKYEGTPMGDIGLNAVYFPNADGSHYVDGIVSHNGTETVYLSGKYHERDKAGYMDATATLSNTPFSLANAFIPEGLVRLEGVANGELEVGGPVASPIVSGDITTDSLAIIADDYNVRLSVPRGVIAVEDSHVRLDNIKAYAVGKNPLGIDGEIDFSVPSRIGLDIRLAAENYQLINAPKTRDALAYGKVYVDLGTRIWGTVDNLKMRGKLNVLGNTDVSYVLKDSPITVQDRLADIVTFCDFADTVKTEAVENVNQNIDMQVNVTVEQAAMAHCILSENGQDRIDLQGGGDLTFMYDMLSGIQLFGRYTIQQGTMSYSLMAIPLNDFQIAGGSYVEFHGNMMNPQLNIKATERVKASVNEGGASRNVAFDVGLALSQTLEDMGLEFTLQAPEDMTVQNELSAMSAEDRGRLAVTMLVTGMYLQGDSGLKGGFSYANTLNSYLQTTINKIAGQALNTIDVNVGIENKTGAEGSSQTDYSFSFAKRFWGNRFSIIVGGKVSTGKDAVNNGQTIIDNISLEYRLDKNSTRYVRLYYDRNYESILEGELTEMGAGIVLRRKSEKIGDLFLFRDRKRKDREEVKRQ